MRNRKSRARAATQDNSARIFAAVATLVALAAIAVTLVG